MTNLKASRSEIERAKESLGLIKTSKNFKEFEDNWRDLINYLEKCWLKSERECQDFKDKFQPWQGSYIALRRKDPLLKYLKQARDSDNHSIQEIVEKIEASQTLRFFNSSIGHINSMIIEKGIITHYDGDPAKIEFNPERVEAKPVTNHGQVFPTPNIHRGKSLKNHKNPIEIAELGIEFYERYLDEIQNKFF